MNIACQDVIRALSNYLDGELPPDLCLELRRHFAGCRHCTAILDGTRNVVSLMGDGRSFELPAGFERRLFGRIAELGNHDA